MQQYLPFTVLKLPANSRLIFSLSTLQQYLPFTVLKLEAGSVFSKCNSVATVPTVYGIETEKATIESRSYNGLQQYLPFTVLKQT